MIVQLRFYAEDPRHRYRVVGEEQGGWWLTSLACPGSAFFVAAASRAAYSRV